MKTKTATLIGIAALACLALCGCGKEQNIGGTIDEPAITSSADTGGEVAWGDRMWSAELRAAPLRASTSSRIKAWWARVVALLRAAIGGDDNTPADPATPAPDPITPVTDPVTPPPAPSGDNSFLWKPVSESRGGRCAVITPANLTVAKVHINGANHTQEYAGRANGNRQHWFQDATGAAYGNSVKVQALNAAGAVLRTWTVPNGGARWASN